MFAKSKAADLKQIKEVNGIKLSSSVRVPWFIPYVPSLESSLFSFCQKSFSRLWKIKRGRMVSFCRQKTGLDGIALGVLVVREGVPPTPTSMTLNLLYLSPFLSFFLFRSFYFSLSSFLFPFISLSISSFYFLFSLS